MLRFFVRMNVLIVSDKVCFIAISSAYNYAKMFG